MVDKEEVSELLIGSTVVGFMTNCYIIGSRRTGEAICIDPCSFRAEQPGEIRALAKDLGVTIKLVVATHGHHDHVVGVDETAKATGSPFLMHQADLEILRRAHTKVSKLFGEKEPVPDPDNFISEDDIVEVSGVRLQVIHTPGHTSGSVSLYCPEAKVVFSGDTLFRGEVGYAKEGDWDREMESIVDKLFKLPDDTIVQPGHQKATMIVLERTGNYIVRSWIEKKRKRR